MSRVYAFRLLIALLALITAFLLTSLAYELVVTMRWNPALAGEGKSRWALLQFQNSRRDPADAAHVPASPHCCNSAGWGYGFLHLSGGCRPT